MSNLKPQTCPFCNEQPEVDKAALFPSGFGYNVACCSLICHIGPSTDYFPSREEAIAVWNIRRNKSNIPLCCDNQYLWGKPESMGANFCLSCGKHFGDREKKCS